VKSLSVTLLTVLTEAREKAVGNISKAQATQKTRYDSKHTSKPFKAGQYVLRKNPRRINRKGSKQEDVYVGPYMVREVTKKGSYLLDGPYKLVDGALKRSEEAMEIKTCIHGMNLKIFNQTVAAPAASPESITSMKTSPQVSPLCIVFLHVIV